MGATHDLVAKYYSRGLPTVFLGPTCTEDYIASSSLFNYFSMGPSVTAGCHYASKLNDNQRMGFNQDTIFSAFFQLCIKFAWININVITDILDSTEQFKWARLTKGN